MTTPDSGTVYVSTHDLELGLAKRSCPYCAMPVLIRLPSMDDAIRGRDSAALRLGLDMLTVTERLLFDTVYSFYPQAVSRFGVMQALGDKFPMEPASFTVHVTRMRKKIERKGWHLLSWSSTLRLVEPQHVIDVEGQRDSASG